MATIFSNRNISLLLFIIITLFLGAAFNVHVGPESFGEDYEKNEEGSNMTPTPSMMKTTTSPSMMQMG
jgi:hypothetical protein